MLISACQTVVGCLSVILGVAAFVYCGLCARNFMSFQNEVCGWTLTSQGIWRGSMVSLSGLAGIIQACIGKRCCNLAVLVLSSLSAFVSLLATGLDVVRLLDTGWFLDSVHEFRSLCLDPREWINDLQWDVYNKLSVSIGGCCFVLCFLAAVLTGCIQCGFRSQTRQRWSRTVSDGYEPLPPPPYSRLEDTATTLSFSRVVSRTTGYRNREQSSRDENSVESQPTVDDLICLISDDESPTSTSTRPHDDVVETRLRPTGDYLTHIQTVTIEGDPSSYTVTAHS